ncbi:MAG: 3-phosphoshikimate 1-carboxyvinyltransferase [Armatimonadetes bacterium]|nr:3-phosphoshikimate 1-carboxyvinyltransferase [Armatimonadota bacterium]
MDELEIRVARADSAWNQEVRVPGDKSLSHRALLLAALAGGSSRIHGLSPGADVESLRGCLARLGARSEPTGPHDFVVEGWGTAGWTEPDDVLDCGNSGTALRLLAGVVASRPGFCVLSGDRSLRSRPMGRVVQPLQSMGARIAGRGGGRFAPLAVEGANLAGLRYHVPVASAQVKSAIMLAGLRAAGPVELTEPGASRDHTERMLASLGVRIEWSAGRVHMEPAAELASFRFQVPGDVSSAAFLVAATVMRPGASLRILDVGLNPGRIAFLEILKRMGAELEHRITGEEMGEPAGEILARGSELRGVEVAPEEVPGAIDELPLLAVVACRARGVTRVTGAQELRVKESDRIGATVRELSRLGASIREAPDGFTIEGPCPLKGAPVDCHGDHRLEMGLAVAALCAEGTTTLRGAGWAAISFPNFWALFPGRHEASRA